MVDSLRHPPTIFLIDDQDANLRLLERMLRREGYEQFVTTTDSREAEALFLAHSPDLVVLDLHMPHLDGFAVLEILRPHIPPGSFVPIVVLTADISTDARLRALKMGAKDFLGKPLDTIEVGLRIKNLLETRFMYLHLEDKVRERTRELEKAQVEVLERLALAAEFRDDATLEHTRRVGEISAALAARLGLPADDVEILRLAAPLHDLGKIAIPDWVLLKRGRLTTEEFEIIKGHAAHGATILAGSQNPHLQLAEQIALYHHEHWNGGGYRPELSGEAIPLAGRIVAVADVFDALMHARPYKEAWSLADAVAEIQRQRGGQFDPHVVDAFMSLLEDGTLPIAEADYRVPPRLQNAGTVVPEKPVSL
jgi:putative two-component system response regulator